MITWRCFLCVRRFFRHDPSIFHTLPCSAWQVQAWFSTVMDLVVLVKSFLLKHTHLKIRVHKPCRVSVYNCIWGPTQDSRTHVKDPSPQTTGFEVSQNYTWWRQEIIEHFFSCFLEGNVCKIPLSSTIGCLSSSNHNIGSEFACLPLLNLQNRTDSWSKSFSPVNAYSHLIPT